MATLYPQYLDPINDTSVADRNEGRESAQRQLRFADYVYESTGSEATSDIIELSLDGQDFPKGTEVFPQLSYFFVETDIATTFTLGAGDLDASAADYAYKNGDAYAVTHVASDANRYATSINASAVGVDVWAGGVAAAVPFRLQSDCKLTVTLEAVVTPVAGGRLRIRVAYFTT